MGIISENFEAKRRKLMAELLTGQENATQLQERLHKPAEDHGPVSIQDLAAQMVRSFTNSLSELSSWGELTESTRISAVDDGAGGGSASSDETEEKKTAAYRDRRGCYKRRRSSDSLVILSPTTGDGCAWRKYVQKQIMNAEYPRCYYRCTYKSQGCKALKQVQRIEGSAHLYRTTYIDNHTCKDTLVMHPQSTVVSDSEESKFIDFQSNIPLKQEHSPNPTNVSSVTEDFSDAKSSLDPWQDVIGLDSFGCETDWASPYDREDSHDFGFRSSPSTGLHGLDIEVNQFGDIDNLHFDQS